MYVEMLKRARRWVDLENESLLAAMRVAASYASGDLVDVGCGDKPYEAIFAPHVRRYVGVEYSETYEPSANARVGRADLVYSGERMPFEAASFDTVLSNQVAEHVPDPAAFMRELTRILKPGGRLILTVPFAYRSHSEPHDYHRFTRFALERYAKDLGLAVDWLDPRGLFWTVICQKMAAHLALKVARMGSDVQKVGAFGYETPLTARPRYWTLPLVGPAVLGLAATARVMDALDPDDSDTLGYLLIATKR